VNRLALTALLLALPVLLGSSRALADQGVAVDIGAIDVTQKLSRGGTYELPAIGVRNPGTETTTYEMGVSHVEGQDGRPVPEEWVEFEPEKLTLEPGQTAPVSVTLDIPSGARPDDYEALLTAQVAAEGEGTTIGAAAATRLQFEVKPSNLLQAWQLEAQTWFKDHQPWTTLAPLVAILALAVWLFRRKFTVSLGRRV
jgi:hypothetical protein